MIHFMHVMCVHVHKYLSILYTVCLNVLIVVMLRLDFTADPNMLRHTNCTKYIHLFWNKLLLKCNGKHVRNVLMFERCIIMKLKGKKGNGEYIALSRQFQLKVIPRKILIKRGIQSCIQFFFRFLSKKLYNYPNSP